MREVFISANIFWLHEQETKSETMNREIKKRRDAYFEFSYSLADVTQRKYSTFLKEML